MKRAELKRSGEAYGKMVYETRMRPAINRKIEELKREFQAVKDRQAT